MKILYCCVIFLFTFSTGIAQQNLFVRVFDENGKKIGKGKLIAVGDSSFTISKNNKTREIPVKYVSLIKARRSLGHTVWIGAAIGAAAVGVLGIASSDPDAWLLPMTAAEGFFAGALVGSGIGSALGTIIGGTRQRPKFQINNSQVIWKKIGPVLKEFANIP